MWLESRLSSAFTYKRTNAVQVTMTSTQQGAASPIAYSDEFIGYPHVRQQQGRGVSRYRRRAYLSNARDSGYDEKLVQEAGMTEKVEMIDGRPRDIYDRTPKSQKNRTVAIVSYSAFLSYIS